VLQPYLVRKGMPVMLWELHVLGWNVDEGSLDRSESVIRKQLCPGQEAAEEVAGVIAGFETLDSGEPTQRRVVSHGDSGRLGATSLKPISVAYPTPCIPQLSGTDFVNTWQRSNSFWATRGARFSNLAQSLYGKSAWNDATRSIHEDQRTMST